MFVIPSIDLMAGEVVRLAQGKATEKKVYSQDPMACARRWEKAGGRVLHLVDLEGAFEGQMRNLEMIGEIARSVNMPCEVGGGIRDLTVAEKILKTGAARVIFGSIACDEPERIAEAVKRFGPEKVVVGIDARNGVVETRGWTKPSGWKAKDLAARMTEAGVIRIIYTDVTRDGMMTGPNIPAVKEMVKSFPGKVIASGGISGIKDLQALDQAGGVEGVIVGRALYEGALADEVCGVEYVLKEEGRPAGGPGIDYAAELNPEQLEAVTAPPGPILVIAGAGSGKTRTLTYRVAWLVEQGVAPEQILLLTFTNKASKEMLARVASLLPHDLSRLWGGTFHHVGNRILRRHADRVGYAKDYTILDREDAEDLISASLGEAGVDPKDKRFPKPEVLAEIFSLAANHRTTVGTILQKQFGYFTEFESWIGKVAEIYLRRKKESAAMDYDDLLTLSLQILEQPDLRERYRERFRHVLVDEYQDTNRLQSDFVDAIGAGHHQIMAVGDDAQSIYSWRGAKVEHILSFPDRHPGTKMVRLETNYRSIPQILELANHAISHNPKQFPKNLRAVREAGVKPALVAVEDGGQQAAFVAQRILELHEEGTSLSDIAILYRAHFHAMEMQLELTRRNIPYTITSGLRFFEQAHIKDVAAHLRVGANPKDEVAFHRLARLLPGVGPKSATKMWNEVAAGKPMAQVKVSEKSSKGWAQLIETLRQIAGKPPAEQVKLVVEGSYGDHVRARYANAVNRLDDLRQLEDYANGFANTADFLTELALLGNTETEVAARQGDHEGEAVRLSSVHQAKGLEYGVVFVIMLCDGLFPSARAMETEEGEEEERRLFYVAVTRAKDELYLSHPRLRMGKGGDAWQTPSRFLNELNRDLVNVWRVKGSAGLGDWS